MAVLTEVENMAEAATEMVNTTEVEVVTEAANMVAVVNITLVRQVVTLLKVLHTDVNFGNREYD